MNQPARPAAHPAFPPSARPAPVRSAARAVVSPQSAGPVPQRPVGPAPQRPSAPAGPGTPPRPYAPPAVGRPLVPAVAAGRPLAAPYRPYPPQHASASAPARAYAPPSAQAPVRPAAPRPTVPPVALPVVPAVTIEPEPLGPPPRPRKRKTGRVVALLVLAAGIGGAVWYGTHMAPATAAVGDCVAQTGSDSLAKVGCGDKSAQFRVDGRQENKTEIDASLGACTAFPKATSAYWEGERGKPGLVLCLEPVVPVTAAK